jgi:hypothetical protein
MDQGFSFASLILSYFLIAGGLFGGTLLAFQLRLGNEWQALGSLAAGAFVGGFIAARASRGSTVVEPALGAVLVIGSICALAYNTPLGKLLWASAQQPTMKLIGSIAGAGLVGAIFGAAISEKLFGESTRSAIPWLLYTALTTFGSSVLVVMLAQLLSWSEQGAKLDPTKVILIGLGGGCLLGGLAVGASARTRPLFAAFLGGGLGVAGLFALINQVEKMDRDTLLGSLILAGAGAIITLIGTALGWAAFGRRHAG